MADENSYWEVRTPLLYGSRSLAVCADETDAREFAEKWGREKIEGFAGLQIHTRTRTVYIEQEDKN